MKTQAAILFEVNKPLQIAELELPRLLSGQVLVEVHQSGICRSQLMEVQGKRGRDKYLPHLLGHEGGGVVVETGKGVRKVKAGDHVVLTWIKSTGLEAPGPVYRLGRRRINAGPITTFCSYTIVSESRCVRVSKSTPHDVAALCGCALPTGAGIVLNELKPSKGSTSAVFGVGGVGLSAVVALRSAGCSMIVAVDREASKLNMASRLGATHTVDAGKRSALDAIQGLTDGKGVDYSVDASGRVEGIEQAFEAVRKFGGLCVFASHPPAGDKIALDPHALISGKQIRGSWGGASRPDADIPKLLLLARQQRIPLSDMITHRYGLEQVNEGLAMLETGRAGRVMLSF